MYFPAFCSFEHRFQWARSICARSSLSLPQWRTSPTQSPSQRRSRATSPPARRTHAQVEHDQCLRRRNAALSGLFVAKKRRRQPAEFTATYLGKSLPGLLLSCEMSVLLYRFFCWGLMTFIDAGMSEVAWVRATGTKTSLCGRPGGSIEGDRRSCHLLCLLKKCIRGVKH